MWCYKTISKHPRRCAFVLFLVLSTIVCVYVVATLYAVKADDPVQRPHIVVIIADDLGWNDVGFHGSDEIPTPNIDALAYNGVVLERHYVLHICTPSRTAFLTGRYPIKTGMQGYPLLAGEPNGIPLNVTLLPEYLKKLGYATHLIGKWHVGYYTKHHTPSHRGFDNFFGYYSGYVQYFKHTIMQAGRTGYDLHRDTASNLAVEYNYEYLTDLLTKEAENVIFKHDTRKPLYLQLAHLAPHSSDADDTMEVRDETEMNATLGYIEKLERRKFASLVTNLDESVGRVVTALKDAEMLANSIILFLSDNGAQTEGLMENYGSNYPLRGLKFTLFEGGVRGVACIYSPLLKNPSRTFDSLIHITDWLPTFYKAAGGNVDDLKDIDGIDQWSSIVNDKNGERQSLLLNIDEKIKESAAIIGRYKLVNGKSAFGKYYGENGTSPSYPSYNVSNILSSSVSSAIAGISTEKLTKQQILNLRASMGFSCANITNFPLCETRCLFDIVNDPCETTDISETKPDIVNKLKEFVESYAAILVNQTNSQVDPASFPENFNGTWMPWRDYP